MHMAHPGGVTALRPFDPGDHLFDLASDVFEETGEEPVTWFKVDDGFHSHSKVLRLAAEGDFEAIALWTVAGSWASDQLTDGWVPRYAAAKLDPDFERHARALERVGLWECARRDDGPGWLFHGWNEDGRQPTAEKVIADRRANAERQAQWRARANAIKSNGVTNGLVTHYVTDPVTPTRPDPTVVLATQALLKDSSPPARADGGKPAAPEGFDEFWRAYPRRVGKKHAEGAYAKALTKASPAVLIAGARFYAMEQKFTDKEFIKHPRTWLNGECWTDEPDTPPPPPLDADEAATLPPLGVPGSGVAPADPFGGDRHMARQAPRYTTAPKPSTTDQRVAEGLRLADYYRSQGR